LRRRSASNAPWPRARSRRSPWRRPSGLGLAATLEVGQRAQLAAHLAQQVLAHSAAGRRDASVAVEAALGLLLAATVLEHAGRFLDDRPPVLGPGVEHRVDLALADDDVLLAADAGVRLSSSWMSSRRQGRR
jgi:hypothetical protein